MTIRITIEAETAAEVRAIAANIAAGLPVESATPSMPGIGQRVRIDWRKEGSTGSVTKGVFTGTVSRIDPLNGRPWHFVFRDIEDPRRENPGKWRTLYARAIVAWVPA